MYSHSPHDRTRPMLARVDPIGAARQHSLPCATHCPPGVEAGGAIRMWNRDDRDQEGLYGPCAVTARPGVHGPAGCACADQRGLRSYEGACSPRARELEYTELDECPGADRGGFATVDARRPAPARRISGAGRGGAVAVENRACSSIPITVC